MTITRWKQYPEFEISIMGYYPISRDSEPIKLRHVRRFTCSIYYYYILQLKYTKNIFVIMQVNLCILSFVFTPSVICVLIINANRVATWTCVGEIKSKLKNYKCYKVMMLLPNESWYAPWTCWSIRKRYTGSENWNKLEMRSNWKCQPYFCVMQRKNILFLLLCCLFSFRFDLSSVLIHPCVI